jgi:putative copper resistance protein D
VLIAPVVAVVVLAATGGADASPPGLPGPDLVTRWGLPAARGVHDVAAALTVGLLVLAAVILPPEPGTSAYVLGTTRTRAVRIAAAAATVWALAGATVLVFTYADLTGTAPFTVVTGAQILDFAARFDMGRSLAASALLAALAATGSWLATRTTTAAIMAVLALAALLPLALTGHATTAAYHEAAVDAQAVHLVAVTVWVGGLTGLAILRRTLGGRFSAAVARYSTLAGWCFAAVAISGLVSAAARLGGWTGLLSTYGALLAAKTVALGALGAAGWAHRRRILPTLGAADTGADTGGGTGRGFAHLAGIELTVMAVATGLAVALARTSPAHPLVPSRPQTTAEALLGHPMPDPLGAAQWVTAWRIDTVWAPLAGLAGCAYLVAVIRLRRRGDPWPVGRTISWVAGCLLLIWATSGAPEVYGSVLFSMHMVEHMTVAMAVPILLVLGAPITLALRVLTARRDASRGPREWLLIMVHARLFTLVAHPLVAAGLFIAGLVTFYYSSAFEIALATHTGHVVMTAHFLATGYLFAWVICGPDPGPRRPPYPFRLILLVATMAFHAFFGVAMMGSVEIIGEDWFAALDRTWGPTLAEDQRRGGALAWGLGDYPVAILTLAMAAAWLRSDERDSRRYDRKADRDGDAELAAYNAHLRHLAEHDGTKP